MKTVYKNVMFNLLIMLSIAGCSDTNNSVISSSNNSQTSSSAKENLNEKAMVVYFSATNNTKNVANYIADHINAPIFALEPVNEYTAADLNWPNSNSRVVKEHNDDSRHIELKNIKFDGFDDASYIFLGAPVWWQELSWVVDDFVKLNDFTNKIIIPFATSSSSSFSVTKLQSYTNAATWMSPKRFSSNASQSSVVSWVDDLNLPL